MLGYIDPKLKMEQTLGDALSHEVSISFWKPKMNSLRSKIYHTISISHNKFITYFDLSSSSCPEAPIYSTRDIV
jgi:hypothetical protein